jgi:nitrate reductase gamma subunit
MLLAVLHRVWGALGVLLGLSVLMLAGGAVAIGLTSGEMAAAITATVFAACAVLLFAVGAANLWASRAMDRRASNGRTAALGLAVLNLFVLPFGTALGIYTYWVLLHNEARAAFGRS